ncbi:hypothetical protein IW261DRAFT_1503247 [Armillaria novae-zelandiae]|uniref:Uncharacterized protein n=1 Tax=Armillaria novae-zelandiae TaxID=153914 RepID=A0AA39NXY9_9AGAR|nr:hypothetical protein IW261DRAFT_1503247 [Armillaria novae-zelandiae]
MDLREKTFIRRARRIETSTLDLTFGPPTTAAASIHCHYHKSTLPWTPSVPTLPYRASRQRPRPRPTPLSARPPTGYAPWPTRLPTSPVLTRRTMCWAPRQKLISSPLFIICPSPPTGMMRLHILPHSQVVYQQTRCLPSPTPLPPPPAAPIPSSKHAPSRPCACPPAANGKPCTSLKMMKMMMMEWIQRKILREDGHTVARRRCCRHGFQWMKMITSHRHSQPRLSQRDLASGQYGLQDRVQSHFPHIHHRHLQCRHHYHHRLCRRKVNAKQRSASSAISTSAYFPSRLYILLHPDLSLLGIVSCLLTGPARSFSSLC